MTANLAPDRAAAPGPHTVEDYHRAARDRLPPVHYDFFAGGARDEITLRANESALARRQLLPRVLRGRDHRDYRDLSVTLFGQTASMPILLSPTAFHRLAHPDGEAATARAAAAEGTIMIVSMAATTAIGDIAAAAPDATLWFQLYLQPDRAATEALVRRAERAGARALVVTVDSAAMGRRERDDRHGFHDLPEGLHCENLRGLPGDLPGQVRPIGMSAEFGWAHLDWLRANTDLPVLLKGVLHPADAALAVAHGVAGLLVSNHGGRQLDTAPATIDALPGIAAAVDGAIPLILDGGIRRGADVVTALALGARAVGIGRPVIWGLAVAGEAGVRGVLDLLRAEFDHALARCGVASPAELTPDLVRLG